MNRQLTAVAFVGAVAFALATGVDHPLKAFCSNDFCENFACTCDPWEGGSGEFGWDAFSCSSGSGGSFCADGWMQCVQDCESRNQEVDDFVCYEIGGSAACRCKL